MSELSVLGKLLIVTGFGLALLGALLVFSDRFPGFGSWLGWFGKLPGDISFKRDNVSFYFPIVTSLVLSVVLSLLFYLFSWLFRR
jgi:hypothetical protein